jgi:hypothetical protein
MRDVILTSVSQTRGQMTEENLEGLWRRAAVGLTVDGETEMKYGKNSDKVQEVIDFVCSGQILNITPAFTDTSVIIENDFNRVVCRARTQDIEEGEDEDKLTWKDIRSAEMRQVYAKMYELSDFGAVEKELTELPAESYKCLRRKLPRQYHEILDEIIGDLYACFFARAVDEAGSPFFERLLSAYQSGAWPCGWEGRYPEGKLAVYAPAGERQ